MARGTKRYRITFDKTGDVFEVEAVNRLHALKLGHEQLHESGKAPAESNSLADFTAKVICLDEPPPSSKYDDKGFERKAPPGRRHPPPQRAPRGVPNPALPARVRGKVKGKT